MARGTLVALATFLGASRAFVLPWHSSTSCCRPTTLQADHRTTAVFADATSSVARPPPPPSSSYDRNPTPLEATTPCVIKVIGVGGGGSNAVDRMAKQDITGVEFWAINTDAQALAKSPVRNTLAIGQGVTRGLGAGGVPDVGRKAAEESKELIAKAVEGADLVFVAAGMGGGTGSGAAPVVAEVAKDMGILTVGVVTRPFRFEGNQRMQQAELAIAEMKSKVDTLITVSNDLLLKIVPDNFPLNDAFKVADEALKDGVVGISDIIVKPGLINVDFADVRTIMRGAGTALMGTGWGKGKTRAQDAAVSAIESPLLDFPIKQAKGIVFNICGGPDLTLTEINAAAQVIYENVADDANIIFGAVVDEKMRDQVSITVLATGFTFSDDSDNKKGLRKGARKEDLDVMLEALEKPTTKKSKPRAPVYEEEEQQQQYEEEEDDRVDSRRWPAREDVDEELDDIEDDEDDRSPPPSKKGGLGRLFKFWKR